MLGAAENTYYYWGDATGYNKMPGVVDPAAWSTSRSEYVPPSEGTNVNSTDANWVIDYKAHLPISMRSEGYYYNIITPTLNLGSISIVNFNYNNIGSYYDSNNNLVSDGNASAKTMLISNANNAYWNIGNFTFTGGTSSATVVFGSSKFNSTQPEVTLGSVDIGIDGKKQIIHADAQFSGTVEVESGTLIMKSSTALGKLTMTGGAFGGIDGGVTVSGADWYGGDIILYGTDTLNGGIADKITVDGKLSKLGDGPIGVDFNGYEILSENIDNEEFFYELLTATERKGFSDDANEDFYAKNLENCLANFEWVGNTLTVSFASVPEPAEIGALIGLLALAIAARRKR